MKKINPRLFLTSWFLIFTVLVTTGQTGLAQSSGAVSADYAKSGGPRKQLATIIYAGLGGAVLGLSTLSFYGRPQDKLSNIAIGFAVGVIGGKIAVTYNAATNPGDFYSDIYDRRLQPLATEEMIGSHNKVYVLNRGIEDDRLSFRFPVYRF